MKKNPIRYEHLIRDVDNSWEPGKRQADNSIFATVKPSTVLKICNNGLS